MKFSPPHHPQKVDPSLTSSGALQGNLPSHVSRHTTSSYAVMTNDGRLQIGAFTLSLDAMIRNLGVAAKLCKRIPERFPKEAALSQMFPHETMSVRLSALQFSEAYEGFKRAMSGAVRDIDFVRCKRKLEGLSTKVGLSREEVLEVRTLLLEGARIATVCAVIDDALNHALSYRTMLQRGRDWIVDRAGSTNLLDPRIRNRLHLLPFEDFNPESLRIELDLMAQRMELRHDGSPVVRDACRVECVAAALLEQGALSRTATLSRGGVETRVQVSSARDCLFSEMHRVNDVFSALQLGRSASRLISSLTNQNVDLVRLCKFVDRSSALGVKAYLESLPSHTHSRLSDLDEWAPRFEGESRKVLSDDERHDLAALLLDAEVCLFVVGHLRAVCSGDENEAFWRSLWSVGINDRDVRAARELVNDPPPLFTCDSEGAQSVVSNAAMMLGFTAEDRSGAGWRVPENPVVSLAWSMTQ